MRAIDGDALRDRLQNLGYDDWNRSTTTSWAEAYKECADIVDEAPTIEPEPHWIPCSERLPEDEYVLISKKPTMISGDKWCVAIAIRTADPRSRKIQWRDSGFGVIQDDKVLAWMPLPDPYREGEGCLKDTGLKRGL